MTYDQPDVGQLLTNVDFAEMLTNVGIAIAEAQTRLDHNSITILQEMCEKDTVSLPALKIENGVLTDEPIQTSMIGAGFQPTFYQFAETIIEIKMTISVNLEKSEEQKQSGEVKKQSLSLYRKRNNRLGLRSVITTTPIDATYTNKYNFNQEGTSLLRTRLVPVPPNNIIQQQLDIRAQAMQMDYELQLKEYELYLEMLRENREKENADRLEKTQTAIENEQKKEQQNKQTSPNQQNPKK